MTESHHIATSDHSASTLLRVAWFDTAYPPKGQPALGDPETLPWGALADCLTERREGNKDGCALLPCRLKREPNGQVRRQGANVLARSAVVLDCETCKATGAVPPPPEATASAAAALGHAAVVYTSHNHATALPRYRVVLPIDREIDPELPAPEVLAERLGLSDVVDKGKFPPASLFYLPSLVWGADPAIHRTITVAGLPLAADWIEAEAGKLLAARQAEQDKIAADAAEAAAKRREARIAAGFNPDDSLIEAIRAHLPDLGSILASHGYASKGRLWRHPNSESGGFGLSVKTFGKVDRVYSHNAGDPLAPGNLPSWCGVKAVDAFDVAAILDFSGNRARAITELGQRFGMIQPPDPRKAKARSTIARLMFRMVAAEATQDTIEAAAYREGERLGLTPSQVVDTARWVAGELAKGRAA